MIDESIMDELLKNFCRHASHKSGSGESECAIYIRYEGHGCDCGFKKDLQALEDHLKSLHSETFCNACAGTGKSLSNQKCMCGGSGLASDAVVYLRGQLFKA